MPARNRPTKDRSKVQLDAESRPALNICIITRDLYGWGKPTDAAAATVGLAQYFASQGHTVTLTWVPPGDTVDDASAVKLVEHFSSHYMIRLDVLTSSKYLLPDLSLSEKASVAAYYHLKEQEFDALYFALEGGLAYYTLLAKELAVFELRPAVNVLANAPMVWQAHADRRFLEDLAEVSIAHMEKYCIEQADSVICASAYMLGWMKQQGWAVAKDARVLPNQRPNEGQRQDQRDTTQVPLQEINELVFYSGPEFHRGLTLFCDTLDILAKRHTKPLTITLLGRFGRILGEHTGGMVLRRSRQWPFGLKIAPRLGAQQIADYFGNRRCLAVFPYHAANTPPDIANCLENGVPFIAADVGGIAEMIDRKSHRHSLCKANPSVIAEKIITILKAPHRSEPKLTAQQQRSLWGRHLDGISRSAGSPKTAVAKKPRKKLPFVSIVMVHHDRPSYLMHAVDAVEKQDYSNFELILVDDGSVLAESHATLDNLKKRFKQRGWKIIRQKNKYLGAARNAGVRASRGERILFVDDDNALFKNAVSVFVRSMEASGADICTAFSKTFYGTQKPADETLGYVQYFPLGGGLDLGFVHDVFGDANAMIKRDVFDKIGFQIEDYGYAHQDWEFYARAALAGLKIRVIPEPLYWYRSSLKGMYRTSHWYENRQPILAAYRKHAFVGLEHIYHLVLSANTATAEREGYRDDLHSSMSNEQHLQLAKLDPESDDAINLLAEIAAAEGRDETAQILSGQGGHPGIRRPRSGPPHHQQRAREWTEAERRSARLATKYPALLPSLLFPPHPEGLFLRPSTDGNVVATLPWVFPPFARAVSATVEIAHQEASPFEFAMALSRPDAVLQWAGDRPASYFAFSGWLKVDRPFEPYELSMEIEALVRMHLSINLAIRLPKGSKPAPANAYWRKLVIAWDD